MTLTSLWSILLGNWSSPYFPTVFLSLSPSVSLSSRLKLPAEEMSQLSLSLSLSLTHTHTNTQARTHTHKRFFSQSRAHFRYAPLHGLPQNPPFLNQSIQIRPRRFCPNITFQRWIIFSFLSFFSSVRWLEANLWAHTVFLVIPIW